MRFAIKSTLSLLAGYVLILCSLVVWAGYELREAASSLMEDTARLIGKEVAASMSGSALDDLLEADAVTRRRLVQSVSDLTQRSDVVASIAVVNQSGQVVVSDEMEMGRQLAVPAVIFQDTKRPQFLAPESPFEDSTYYLLVPLLRGDNVEGYIRLSLSSRRIARMYGRARGQIALAALAGMGCVGGLGVLLHIQLTRRGAALARTLEATARGEQLPDAERRDEFSEALEAAGRLGRELNETRERSSRISAVANFMDVGVLLLSPDRRLEFSNAAARELLGAQTPEELQRSWEAIAPSVVEVLGQLKPHRSGSASIDVEVPTDERVRSLRLELYRPTEEEHEGFLVLLKDREMLEAFETDLRLASQMRGLARIYSALAHELKAPMGAMALNLELLEDALRAERDDAPDARERRQRYATVLRDELARLNRSLVAVLNQTTSLREAHERFDLREVVRDLETLLGPQARQQRVRLEMQLPERDIPLAGQRDRLKQAFLNIATNALEAMPEGGRLDLSMEANNGHAIVSIQDSGPGIPPEIVGKMYAMYFTTKSGGSGIGLYVSRSIVESHGGEIQVNSRAGGGTCFRVTLPLAAEEA